MGLIYFDTKHIAKKKYLCVIFVCTVLVNKLGETDAHHPDVLQGKN